LHTCLAKLNCGSHLFIDKAPCANAISQCQR
jgi:hypothetical protein